MGNQRSTGPSPVTHPNHVVVNIIARFDAIVDNMNTCSVDNCERESRARGYCQTHYQSARRSGEMLTTEQLARVVNTHKDQITAWMRDAGWTPPDGS